MEKTSNSITTIKKIVFFGTPEFAVPALKRLANSNYKPVLVVTQPDKPQGRKLKLEPPPVKIAAESEGLRVLQPENLKETGFLENLEAVEPDLIITVAYGGFLTRKILNLPSFGCLNLHPSLLPLYRGATPINQALFNGDIKTGNTIFQMSLKMDNGPILMQREKPVFPEDNYTSLSARLAEEGANELIETVEQLEKKLIIPRNQDDTKATYCYKLEKDDLIIDWNKPALDIHHQVRGLANNPAAATSFRDKKIKILETETVAEKTTEPVGTILPVTKRADQGILIACSDSILVIMKLQPAGKKTMTGFEFSLGARFREGERFS